MKRITIEFSDKDSIRFTTAIKMRAHQLNFNRVPTYKEIVLEALELLYAKENYSG